MWLWAAKRTLEWEGHRPRLFEEVTPEAKLEGFLPCCWTRRNRSSEDLSSMLEVGNTRLAGEACRRTVRDDWVTEATTGILAP